MYFIIINKSRVEPIDKKFHAYYHNTPKHIMGSTKILKTKKNKKALTFPHNGGKDIDAHLLIFV